VEILVRARLHKVSQVRPTEQQPEQPAMVMQGVKLTVPERCQAVTLELARHSQAVPRPAELQVPAQPAADLPVAEPDLRNLELDRVQALARPLALGQALGQEDNSRSQFFLRLGHFQAFYLPSYEPNML
jgi:hypothetical protein